MCGICGIVTTNQTDIFNTLRTMNKAIIHRGPDDDGYCIADNIGLAMRRLSIIDLETGHQPMFSIDKRLVIIFNGEIYNYKELKERYLKEYIFSTHSDTEVILNLFHKMGKECLDLLNGIFAFAIYDFQKQELFIARDHIGVKPLYYYSDKYIFLFSSDIISFHEIPFIELSINHSAIAEYLRFGYIPHPFTIFSKVHKLRPGHYAIINNKVEISTFQYYKFWQQLTPVKFADFNSTKEDLRQLIHNSVEKQMVSDVPLGAFLSGGIDSSIVTTEMASISKEPVNTFTIGFHGAGNNMDLVLSSLLSKNLKTNHHERIIVPELNKTLDKIINSLGEPFAITSAIPIYINSSIAREKVKVVLSGDGADEVFGGYGRYDNFFRYRNFEWMRFLPLSLINDLIRKLISMVRSNKMNKAYLFRIHPFLSSISQPDAYQRHLLYTGKTDEKTIRDIMSRDYFMIEPVHSYANEFVMLSEKTGNNANSLMAFDVYTSLVDEMLTKVDFASMLASLEVRVPFLDRRIVEFGLSLPPEFKISHSKNKVILREAYATRLPLEVTNAPKRGFNLPLDNWIKNNWVSSFKDTFNNPLLDELGIDRKSLIKLFDKYLAGFPAKGKMFYYIFILANWYEKFMLKRSQYAI